MPAIAGAEVRAPLRDRFDEILTPAALAVLDGRPNQLDRLREDVDVNGPGLLAIAETPGQVTLAGLRNNVSVAVRYLAAWLGGNGAVAIFNLMEDAATAEIARSQVWQWRASGIATARELSEAVALAGDYPDFLTGPAYRLLD